MAKEFTREFIRNVEYRSGIMQLTGMLSREREGRGIFALGRSVTFMLKDMNAYARSERMVMPTVSACPREAAAIADYAEWICERVSRSRNPMVVEDTFVIGIKLEELGTALVARGIRPDIVVLVPPRPMRIPYVRYVLDPNPGLAARLESTRSTEALLLPRVLRNLKRLLG